MLDLIRAMKKFQHCPLIWVLIALLAGCGSNDGDRRVEESLKPIFKARFIIFGAVMLPGRDELPNYALRGAVDSHVVEKFDRLAAVTAASEVTSGKPKAVTNSQLEKIATIWNRQNAETFKDFKFKFVEKTQVGIRILLNEAFESMDKEEWDHFISICSTMPEPTRTSILTSIEKHRLMKYFVKEEIGTTTSPNP